MDLGFDEGGNHALDLSRFSEQPLLDGESLEAVRGSPVALVSDDVSLQVAVRLDAAREVLAVRGDIGRFGRRERERGGRRRQIREDGFEVTRAHDGVQYDQSFELDLSGSRSKKSGSALWGRRRRGGVNCAPFGSGRAVLPIGTGQSRGSDHLVGRWPARLGRCTMRVKSERTRGAQGGRKRGSAVLAYY